MNLKKIKHLIYHDGYENEEIEYKCPCGKDIVIEYKDKEPGFRWHTAYIRCKECDNKYELINNKGYYDQVKLKEVTK